MLTTYGDTPSLPSSNILEAIISTQGCSTFERMMWGLDPSAALSVLHLVAVWRTMLADCQEGRGGEGRGAEGREGRGGSGREGDGGERRCGGEGT